MTNHKIIFGDSRQMRMLEDQSVNLIITSPPYWQLKDYGEVDQIGFNDSYEEYINNLNMVWKECFRVLTNGCRLCINIGDQFARSVYYGRYKVIPIHEEIIRFCETIGFDYMGSIIWQKATTMNTSGGAAIMGSYPYPRNGIIKMDYEFILIFKKLGDGPKPTKEQKKASELTKEEWNEYFKSHWNFGGAKQSEHIAMFPEELPRRLIKMFSYVGDTIFDPFLGSGTTTLAAMNLERNSVGYELNPDFKPVIEEKLCKSFNYFDCNIEFLNDLDSKITNNYDVLPYVFKDVCKLDKTVDVKKMQFGSKIDKNSSKKETYTVKEVLSPSEILLSNGKIAKLIGVVERNDTREQAMDFLKGKLKGHSVMITLDEKVQSNEDNVILCYLYLDNRTYINNHLIRTGLVEVDQTCDYKHREKFLKEYNNGKGVDIK